MTTVLIADDEPVVLKIIARFLERDDRTLLVASSAAEALRLAAARGPVDVALLDKNLGDGSGLDVARELKRQDEHVQVILLTAYASFQSAVEAVQIGAYDYLTKPIEDFDALGLRIDKAAEAARLAREHRRIVAELAESEARNRQILEAMPDGLIVFDQASGEIQAANGAATRMLGADGAALLGREVGRCFDGGAAADDAGAAPVPCRRLDGSTFPAEVRRARLAWRGRALSMVVVRDVTERERLAEERRQAEEQLRHAQRLDALGRLAGGIGHDLGNMLAVVLVHAEMLAAGRATAADVESIRAASARAAGLVRQMMSLSRRAEPGTPCRLEAAVQDVARLLRTTLGAGVTLEVTTAPTRSTVPLDAGQVAQIVLNLAVNARDAMPDGGRLAVRTEPAGDAGWVALVVTDTGAGMTEEVRARIFEPFFTTKPEGKGTGLGLPVTQGLVSQAGGRIELESAPGRGTTVRVLLPVLGAVPAPAPAPPAAPGRSGPHPARTVLLVEDDAHLRQAAARALAGAGLGVLQAASGEEAIELLRRTAAPDLLLADVVMPGLSGEALAAAVVRDAPGVKVLLMTGSPDDPGAAAARERGVPVLDKPFGEQALVERVRALVP